MTNVQLTLKRNFIFKVPSLCRKNLSDSCLLRFLQKAIQRRGGNKNCCSLNSLQMQLWTVVLWRLDGVFITLCWSLILSLFFFFISPSFLIKWQNILVIIKTQKPVFWLSVLTTDVTNLSNFTHFLALRFPPVIFVFPWFSAPLQSEGNDRQKNSALPSVPSLLEVFGFSYFYGGFLVGPQFTLLKYQQLVNRELTDCQGKPPSRLEPESDISQDN